jgi:predicted amidohydrolase YtcJ
MILANATIYTADPARPFADAMAIRVGRVLRVGTYESVKVVSMLPLLIRS